MYDRQSRALLSKSLSTTFVRIHYNVCEYYNSTIMAQSYPLFCMGNPLLDMQVTNGEELLKKYKLNANDAILAGEDQAEMYASDLVIVKDNRYS